MTGVGDYLPSFKNKKGSITVRQLLSHTSGLPEVQVIRSTEGGAAQASTSGRWPRRR